MLKNYLKNSTAVLLEHKPVKIIAALSLSCLILWGTYLAFSVYHKNSQVPNGMVMPSIYEGVSLKGLSFDEYENDEKLYSLKIGSFGIKRGRIGFLKVGLWKEAVLEDVVLDVQERCVAKGKSVDIAAAGQGEKEKAPVSLIGHLADNKQVASLQMDKVKGIRLTNLVMNIMRDKDIVSTISSANAKIDSLGKRLLLQGQVKISTKSNGVLTCDEMCFMDQGKEFKIDGVYALTVGHRLYKGKGVRTNYLLEGLGPQLNRRGV